MKRNLGNHKTYAIRLPSCVDRRSSLILLTGIVMVIPFLLSTCPLAGQTSSAARTHKLAAKQHFACNTGYTRQECDAAVAILRKAQAPYHVDALGKWTWVLVRTVDWKQMLSQRAFDTNDPAFSNLTKRETFLDGALVVRTSTRGAELSYVWHMPIGDLLDLAIRHELAHALCNDRDEIKAQRAAIALRNGTPLSCRVVEQASAVSPK